ncbi:MAG TPA: hypothetical protein VE093_47120 [Polyangiaceae bacterium]|nr:hypothetical protein [Polyangiaceae bacterium]
MIAKRRPAFALAAFALASLSPSVAPAQARDPAAAEALYKAGRELVAKGDWDAACPKFEASMSLDPAASTLINIAKCHEHFNRLSRAWADYKRALVLNQDTPGAERRKTLGEIATRGVQALEPRLPKMRIAVVNPPPGLRVTRDGQELPVAVLGEVIPVDPGSHEVSASAPGYALEQRTVKAEEGKTVEVELRLTQRAAQDPAAGANSASGGAGSSGASPPSDGPDAAKGDSGGIPTWVWIVGGAGVVMAGAGVAFRIDGSAAEARLDENCGEARLCDPASGYDPTADNDRKNRDFVLFAVLGGAGAAAVGAAVIGAIVAPPKVRAGSAGAVGQTALGRRIRAGGWVSPSGFGASLEGVF